MKLNFVILESGKLKRNYYGESESVQEFRDRYYNGMIELEDNSEVEYDEIWVRDFRCPVCKQLMHWLRVDGPNDLECMIQCKQCQTSFAVDNNDCSKCSDREVKCLAVIPPKGL